MLYKHTETGVLYTVAEGFAIVINQNGTVQVKSRHSGNSANYIDIKAFELAITNGEQPMVYIHYSQPDARQIPDFLEFNLKPFGE